MRLNILVYTYTDWLSKRNLGDYIHQSIGMRNNIIAIIVISFVIVGTLWGVGNLIKQPERSKTTNDEDVVLVANRNTFNETNPSIHVSVNVPKKLLVRNNDFVTHDLKIDKAPNDGITPINTAPLRGGQDFPTAIVAEKPGVYEYYCSFHPQMRGEILAQ